MEIDVPTQFDVSNILKRLEDEEYSDIVDEVESQESEVEV